jgi:serine/threonine-protein kinase
MLRSSLDPRAVKPGTILGGRYEIVSRIAAGGMGVVYRARHRELDQPLAIKVLALNDPTVRARFEQEAKLLARLRGEHVCRVIDFSRGEDDALPYLVLEYLEGMDLATLLRSQGKQETTKAVDWILQALVGLAEAHALGIVHRDVKPANLFLARDPGGAERIKVMDFGIAKATGANAVNMTGTFTTLGTIAYAAPEVLRSARTADLRCDLWSMGVTLYHLLTKRRPFEGASAGETAALILREQPVPPRTYEPDLPEALERVLLRCVERDPSARFQTVADLASALAPFGHASEIRAADRVFGMLGQTIKMHSAPDFSEIREAGESPRPVEPETQSESEAATESTVRDEALEEIPESPASASPPRSARRFVLIGAAALSVIGLLTVVWSVRSADRDARHESEIAPAVATQPVVAPPARATEPALSEPEPVPLPEPTQTVAPAASTTVVSERAHPARRTTEPRPRPSAKPATDPGARF